MNRPYPQEQWAIARENAARFLTISPHGMAMRSDRDRFGRSDGEGLSCSDAMASNFIAVGAHATAQNSPRDPNV